jgi:hypothetical protein
MCLYISTPYLNQDGYQYLYIYVDIVGGDCTGKFKILVVQNNELLVLMIPKIQYSPKT